MDHNASRAKRHAGGGPLERRVRQHAARRSRRPGRDAEGSRSGFSVLLAPRAPMVDVLVVPGVNGSANALSAKRQEERTHPKRAKHYRNSKPSLRGPLGRAAAVANHSVARVCLTFELSGRHRQGAWAARRMMTQTASRPKRLAGGGPLERRVSRHSRAGRALQGDACIRLDAEHCFLLEPGLVRRDEFQYRLLRRRALRMNEAENVGRFLHDSPRGRAPLTGSLPGG